ncbi:hypothetical protein DFR75_101435 [Nocardia ignorata]|uniref:Uncharacterized protein n=1 Tax=Nocardia ignorata TaxID=145285 RepID=A0A4R6PV88_NOCIG|nr:hypothetical protein DFR75_101435 [Nocardia ignorata]
MAVPERAAKTGVSERASEPTTQRASRTWPPSASEVDW